MRLTYFVYMCIYHRASSIAVRHFLMRTDVLFRSKPEMFPCLTTRLFDFCLFVSSLLF